MGHAQEGYKGTYQRMSAKHFQRLVNEFAGRHNDWDMDTIAQMAAIARGFVGWRLLYRDLIASKDTSISAGGSDVLGPFTLRIAGLIKP